MFDKMTLVTAQAKEFAGEAGHKWNFLSAEEKQEFLDKAESSLTALFHPDGVTVTVNVDEAMVSRVIKESIASIECPKCMDRGFIEKQAGQIREFCDCPAGDRERAAVGAPPRRPLRISICEACKNSPYPQCLTIDTGGPKNPVHEEVGDLDIVVQCAGYAKKVTDPKDATSPGKGAAAGSGSGPKAPGRKQYWCTKCQQVHNKASQKGEAHIEFKGEFPG